MSPRTFALALLVALGISYPGHADEGWGGSTDNGSKKSSGGVDGDKISAQAGGVVYDLSKNGSGKSAGPVTSTTSWTPPACWYAPKYTPAHLKAYLEPIWASESTGYEWDAQQRDRYVNGHPYKDFNRDKTDKGYWWDLYVNDSYPPGWNKCDEPVFWVDKGAPPPADVKNAVTPRILAELAYNEIRVPSTKVSLAPADGTTVNLPTWAWLEGAKFTPVSVTATVPVLNISATTTAEPIALRIDPGTTDAVTYPASGVCHSTDGRIGEPYATRKAGGTPPCGVKYLRSSGESAYLLKAIVTWKIHWTGTGTAGGDLPDGTFGATQEVVVQEIQAINR